MGTFYRVCRRAKPFRERQRRRGRRAARWGFGAYLAGFGPYGHLYDPLAAIVASLAWMYVSAAIFIWGGDLASVLTERAHGSLDAST